MPHVAAYQRKSVGVRPGSNLSVVTAGELPRVTSPRLASPRMSAAWSQRSSRGVQGLKVAPPAGKKKHTSVWDFGSVRHLKQLSHQSSDTSVVDPVFDVDPSPADSMTSGYTYTSFIPELEDTSPHKITPARFPTVGAADSKALQRRTTVLSPAQLAHGAINAIQAIEGENRMLQERLYRAEELTRILQKENEEYKSLCHTLRRPTSAAGSAAGSTGGSTRGSMNGQLSDRLQPPIDDREPTIPQLAPAPVTAPAPPAATAPTVPQIMAATNVALGPHPAATPKNENSPRISQILKTRPISHMPAPQSAVVPLAASVAGPSKDDRPEVPLKNSAPATPVSEVVPIMEAPSEPGSDSKIIKPLRMLRTAKSFTKKPVPSTLASVPASPREDNDFVTALAPRPARRTSPTPVVRPKTSRGPSPSQADSPPRAMSRQEDSSNRSSAMEKRRSQSQPPARPSRPTSPLTVNSGIRQSFKSGTSQALNLTDPNIYSSTAMAYSTSSLKGPGTPKSSSNRFSLASRSQQQQQQNGISPVIPGSVSRHPVALHGVPLSPVKSVPVISIKEAQKRAKNQKSAGAAAKVKNETPLRQATNAQQNAQPMVPSSSVQDKKRSGMASVRMSSAQSSMMMQQQQQQPVGGAAEASMKRKHSFARFMDKFKVEKTVPETKWDWI